MLANVTKGMASLWLGSFAPFDVILFHWGAGFCFIVLLAVLDFAYEFEQHTDFDN